MTSTIFLIHGWGTKAGTWEEVEQVLKYHGYNCISVKLPGFDLPEPPVPWGVPEYASFVEGQIAGWGVSTPVTLIGHSFGGRIATWIAATRPGLVDKLILTSSAGVENRRTFKIISVGLLSKFFKLMDGVPVLNIATRYLRKVIFSRTGSRDYQNASLIMRETLKKVVSLNLTPHLSSISALTLLIWGSLDEDTPVSEALTFRRYIKNSQLRVIDGAGHFVYRSHVNDWITAAMLLLGEYQ